MQKKIFELEENNRELKEELKIKKTLAYKAEAYYSMDDGKEGGPFCSLCYDTKKVLVRMTHWDDDRNKRPNCEKIYQIK